jgi:hypothetical protein
LVAIGGVAIGLVAAGLAAGGWVVAVVTIVVAGTGSLGDEASESSPPQAARRTIASTAAADRRGCMAGRVERADRAEQGVAAEFRES